MGTQKMTSTSLCLLPQPPVSDCTYAFCGFDETGLREVESRLPFAVEGHPSAKSHVAKEMLRRLKEDVQYFANEVCMYISLAEGCLYSTSRELNIGVDLDLEKRPTMTEVALLF